MRARLLALAAFLAAAAGGGIYFVNFNTATVDRLSDGFGALEVIDRSQCTMANCNAAACNQAANILADAGSACTLKLVDCPIRLGPRARAMAADAGVIFSASKYQQVRLIAMRCAGVGGPNFAVPVDDNGWPSFATTPVALTCAWKPVGGSNCVRLDGGDPGNENTMQPGQFVGAGCVLKSCWEFAGDSSAP